MSHCSYFYSDVYQVGFETLNELYFALSWSKNLFFKSLCIVGMKLTVLRGCNE